MDVQDVIRLLGLEELPVEGGYFRETWRSKGAGPLGQGGAARSHGTAIYYLHAPGTRSLLHRLSSDEVYHFYAGDPVELVLLPPDGPGESRILSGRLDLGHAPQIHVPAGTWQGSRLGPGGSWALLGTTVTPGFDFEDFELGPRDALLAAFPGMAEWIGRLT